MLTFGPEAGVSAALKTGPTSGEVAAFIDGSGPPCLFITTYLPRDDSDSPREISDSDKGGAAEEQKEKPAAAPVIVAHTGLAGYPYASAGMAEAGRICYFLRSGDVNRDVAQDLSVVFGEFQGDPTAAISAFLSHVARPVVDALGAVGKSSGAHVADYLKALGRLTKELDETSAAMAVRAPTRTLSRSWPCLLIYSCTHYGVAALPRRLHNLTPTHPTRKNSTR